MQGQKSTFGVRELFSLLCSAEGYPLKMTMFKLSFLKSAVSISLFFYLLVSTDSFWIAEGSFYLPNHLSSDARSLIISMLVVDPVKRITIPDITQHPFFTTDLPRYLTPLPPPPGPVLGTLSSLVTAPKILDFEIIEGLGRIEEDVVDDLANVMVGVEKGDIWECLRRDDGVQGNAVKVAYLLLRDKRRLGKDCKLNLLVIGPRS